MEMKPPISRAKMILITKAAIKAIKVKYNEKNMKL